MIRVREVLQAERERRRDDRENELCMFMNNKHTWCLSYLYCFLIAPSMRFDICPFSS